MTSTAKPKIAIIGYGSRGRARTRSTCATPADVTIACARAARPKLKAKADGFTAMGPPTHPDGDIVAILTPDMVQLQLYGEVIEPNIRRAPACCSRTASTSITARSLPRDDLDVVPVAPKGRGAGPPRVRDRARRASVYAIHQDRSGRPGSTWRWPTAPASAARARTRSGFFEEPTDLFGEQAVPWWRNPPGVRNRLRKPWSTATSRGRGIEWRTQADRRPVL